MSDTPRVDAALTYNPIVMRHEVTADFARTLERELTNANKRVKELAEHLASGIPIVEQMIQRISDLERVGGELAKQLDIAKHYATTLTFSNSQQVLTAWQQLMEDKQ